MKTEVGEIITLDNNKEYICTAKIENENNTYLYLVSNFKPLEICFAREEIKNNENIMTIIGDVNEKRKIFKLFQDAIKK